MNRALFAVGVGIVGLSMAMMGCATSVDDPVPAPVEPVQQLDPPAQTLSGDLRQPQSQLLGKIGETKGFDAVPVQQHPRIPTPTPEDVLPQR